MATRKFCSILLTWCVLHHDALPSVLDREMLEFDDLLGVHRLEEHDFVRDLVVIDLRLYAWSRALRGCSIHVEAFVHGSATSLRDNNIELSVRDFDGEL